MHAPISAPSRVANGLPPRESAVVQITLTTQRTARVPLTRRVSAPAGVVTRHIDRVYGVPRLTGIRASSPDRVAERAARSRARTRQASIRLPEWFAKLQDAVALNCCKRRRVERARRLAVNIVYLGSTTAYNGDAATRAKGSKR